MSDPIVKRTGSENAVGVEVASLGVTLFPSENSTINGVAAAAFALSGGFDGANIVVDRVYAADWVSDPAGNLNVFTGHIGDVEVVGTRIELDCKDDRELLNMQIPRNLYMAQCMHTLYDSGCKLAAANFTVSGNVGSGSTRYAVTSNLTANAGTYDLGIITVTSGPMANLTRTVKAYYANGLVEVSFPLPQAPSAGVTFSILPGCDKTRTTCNGPLFNNELNFRGYPYIPVPETTF